jgi:hypothetical protein
MIAVVSIRNHRGYLEFFMANELSLEMGDILSLYIYSVEIIDECVKDKSIGNYALGYLYQDNEDKEFVVEYVGRSDKDLRKRLKEHKEEGYRNFKFSYAKNAEEAYYKECRNYHDFGEDKILDNQYHPDKPNEQNNLRCPYPNCKH